MEKWIRHQSVSDRDELYHHGILGQKWGVRRYQNEDGTLTEAGKIRYYKEMEKVYKKENLRKQAYDIRDKLDKEVGGDVGKSTEYLAKAKTARDKSRKAKLEKDLSNAAKPEEWIRRGRNTKIALSAGSTLGGAVFLGKTALAAKSTALATLLGSSAIAPAATASVAFISGALATKEILDRYGDKEIFKFSSNSKKELKHSEIQNGDELYHFGTKGMRWGRRRYQNPDGTLTELGKQRLRETRDAMIFQNPDKYDTTDKVLRLNDRLLDKKTWGRRVDEWVAADLSRYKKATEAGSATVRNLQQLEQVTRPKAKQNKRLNLEGMSDQELRERINREMLERQYNDVFNKSEPKVSKGRERVQRTLEIGGAALGVASTAVGIALALKELKKD